MCRFIPRSRVFAMLRKLVLLLAALLVTMSTAFAGPVDANTADQATLQTLKGLGPVKSKAIVDERTKNGPFKDANDLANRVTGLGPKSVSKLEAEGLTVGGSSAPPTGAGTKHQKAAAPAAAAAAKQSQGTAIKSAPQATTVAPAASTKAASSTQSSKSKKKKKDKSKAGSAASGT
jgi:competence protein ComEA